MKISVKKLHPAARLPVYATEEAAGADLCACLEAPVTIGPGETAMIPTGLAVEIPRGYVGLVFGRSGLALKRDLAPANKVGVIDSDYRGELKTGLHNHGTATQTVEPGERISQLVLVPYLTAQFTEADSLSDTQRGTGGFGSTGTR